jgi:hypothetical protein
MRARWLIGMAMFLALGCASEKYAPVSGKVTLNGQPLANAVVSFQPIAPEGKLDAGPGSTGKTNDKGEYTLQSMKGINGAMVGQHRVNISTQSATEGDLDGRGRQRVAELIPDRYNRMTQLTFDVRPGGTKEADFALQSP